MMRAGAFFSLAWLLLEAAADPAAAAVIHVDVKGVAFVPGKVSARVGDTIEWSNKDFVAHTATARSGGSWNIDLPPGKNGRTVLSKAGRAEYYCRFHPNMKGEIEVAK